jgi:hypothetical protein
MTGTSIGVDISQNPQTQMYQAKLGYNRGEMAIVPSNRSAKKDPGEAGGGAKDTTDVLMELRYAGIFSQSDAAIYQRLAVGPTAVAQPGAAMMLAKNAKGELDPATANAVKDAIMAIPSTPTAVSNARAPLRKAYLQLRDSKDQVFKSAAVSEGYSDFQAFLAADNPSPQQIQNIRRALESDATIKAKIAEIEGK